MWCTPGNHDRWSDKNPGRAISQKYDGPIGVVYSGLRAIFRDQDDVTVHFPKTPWTAPMICGRQHLLTHGDTSFGGGSPGIRIDIKKITEALQRFDSAGHLGQRVEALWQGHYHVPDHHILGHGAHLVTNGCKSGLGPYAQSLDIFDGPAVQIVAEATSAHAVGDLRMIELRSADTDAVNEQAVSPPPHICHP